MVLKNGKRNAHVFPYYTSVVLCNYSCPPPLPRVVLLRKAKTPSFKVIEQGNFMTVIFQKRAWRCNKVKMPFDLL